MEHSPGLTTCWTTKQASVNLRKLKIYQASFLTTTLRDLKSITRKNLSKKTNKWKLNNMLLNNQWITEDIKKYLETNDNKNMTIKNLCDGSFPGGAVVENLPANAGVTGSSPGPGRSHMLQNN